jgi:hypothetical protein
VADEPAPSGARPSEPDPASGARPSGQQDPGTGARPDGQGSTEGARPDTALGDGGREALDRERAARRDADRQLAEARTRLADLENAGKTEVERARSDLDRATKRIEELEGQAHERELIDLRREIAEEVDLPASLAKRIQGDDARSMRADAKKLKEELDAGTPVGDIGIGRGGAAGSQRGRVDMNTLIRQAAGR